MQTYTWFMADKPGQYKIFCTEFCGIGHSEMLADLKIVSPQAYQDWLSQKPEPLESMGEKYAKSNAVHGQLDLAEFHQLKAKVNFFWKADGQRLHVRLKAATTGCNGYCRLACTAECPGSYL